MITTIVIVYRAGISTTAVSRTRVLSLESRSPRVQERVVRRGHPENIPELSYSIWVGIFQREVKGYQVYDSWLHYRLSIGIRLHVTNRRGDRVFSAPLLQHTSASQTPDPNPTNSPSLSCAASHLAASRYRRYSRCFGMRCPGSMVSTVPYDSSLERFVAGAVIRKPEACFVAGEGRTGYSISCMAVVEAG